MFHQISEGIPAEFSVNSQNQVCITFRDPEYVCADLILFDPRDSSLHAVLHESLHLIGWVEGDLKKSFSNRSEVFLSAPHYFSGTINLKTPLVISN
jgi:hypothetical protein